jgi:hypothetical protein
MATKKSKPKRMSGAEYRAAIDALGLNQLAAARFLKIGDRTSRRYIAGGAIPHAVALLLNLMIEKKIKPQQLGFEG